MDESTLTIMKESIGPGCYIRLRGKTWHVVFSDVSKQPRQKERSLKTSNKAKASADAYEMNRQREIGRFDPWKYGDATTSVHAAVRHYLRSKENTQSIRDCARMLERVCEYSGITYIMALTPERITAFIYRTGLSDYTRWSYHNKLGSVINWLFAAGYWEQNPLAEVRRPTEPQTIPRHYGEEEFERFLEACKLYVDQNAEHTHRREAFPLWFIPCFELIAYTGMRPAEAMRLNWDDIVWPSDSPDGIGQVLVVGPTKTKVERVITMHPRAERTLRWLQANTRRSRDGDEPVLKNGVGTGRISKAYLGVKFTRIQKFARMKAIGLYGLRHTYAALLRRQGVELHLIKEEFGHKDYRTTEKYGKLGTSERMRAVFRRIS